MGNEASSNGTRIRVRWAAIGAAIAVTLGAGGVGIAGATLGSGERTSFVPINPCRIADTRPGDDNRGPRATPLGAGETHIVSAWGEVGDCNLTNQATGLVLNVTTVNQTQLTYLTIYPTGATQPLTSNLNPSPGQPPTPNAVTVDLNGSGQFSIYNLQGSVDVIVDIVGYYEDHNHDDRYYTKTQTYSKAETYSKSEINAQRGGEYTCGAADFFPASSTSDYVGGTGTRYPSGTTQLQCSAHLPVGATVSGIRAAIGDSSAALNGNCLFVYYPPTTNNEFQTMTTASTTGTSGTPQIVNSGPAALVTVTSGYSYGIRCNLADAPTVAIRSATITYSFP